MVNGHGDDLYKYPNIRINFSSNIYSHFDHSGLFAYLSERMGRVTHYPEPVPVTLEKAIADDLGIKPSEVMVTNGATEAIYLIARTYSEASSVIMNPTFSEYADACYMNGHNVVYVMDDNAEIFQDDRTQLLWMCVPNNPTGMVMGNFLMKSLLMGCENEHKIVVFDASYAKYTNEKILLPADAVKKYPHTIMIHSMTKDYGVPGLRLGYITGNEDALDRIRVYRQPWSVNQLAQDAGLYLLKHKDDYRIDVSALMKERERVAKALEAIPGIKVAPSDSHILLCRITSGTASELKDYLAAKHGMLIRDASNFAGLSLGHFRIAVQTREEDDELIEAISEYVKGSTLAFG